MTAGKATALAYLALYPYTVPKGYVDPACLVRRP